MRRITFAFVLFALGCNAQSFVVTPEMHRVVNDEPPSVSNPSATPKGGLNMTFEASDTSWRSMRLRQLDVKEDWQVTLNSQTLGSLIQDEKDLTKYFVIPRGVIVMGRNKLEIRASYKLTDEIRVGEIKLYKKAVSEVLSECNLDITILDRESRVALPSRITILDEHRSMAPLIALNDERHLAVRNGCVYTSTGKARLGLPTGRYTIFANRGFEYGVDSVTIDLTDGNEKVHTFSISREVDTKGWVASDPHVHTFTHSRHGDATDRERVITLAGEGIELPIITDHNLHVDLGNMASSVGVRSWFTPVTGNEVTTNFGHFNVFPMESREAPLDVNLKDWNELATRLQTYANPVIILNHANDMHRGFKPFDDGKHVSSAGIDIHNWTFPANAMEVMNSGSQQRDIMKLYFDWFGMLNGGRVITPIGSSDSHDVCRYIVGQGRTYIKGKDDDPANINVNEMIKSIHEGKVMVSAGLMTKLVVNDVFGPGDLVPKAKKVQVDITVTGPSWTKANKIMLFMNGFQVKEDTIVAGSSITKWSARWTIDIPEHDVFFAAIATGPGAGIPFWPIEKPFQGNSDNWKPMVIGSSGAVWIDGDGNGVRNTAIDYAKTIFKKANGKIKDTVPLLKKYDRAIACQVAALWWQAGGDVLSQEFDDARQIDQEVGYGFYWFRQDAIEIGH